MNQTILENCKKLLENYPELREIKNIRRSVWAYWMIFHNVGDSLSQKLYYSGVIPREETITAAYRHVKRMHAELRGSEESQSQGLHGEMQVRKQFRYGMTKEERAEVEQREEEVREKNRQGSLPIH